MSVNLTFAASREEKEAVYRLRYDVYVKQMNIFGEVADHERQMFSDADDSSATLIYATDGDQIIGTVRVQFGVDFSDETHQSYHIERFLSVVPASQILLLTRLMVRREYRSSSLPLQLMTASARFGIQNQVELAFCDCEPHLLSLYKRVGFRPYAKTIEHPGVGIAVPMVMLVSDHDYFRRIRSPYANLAEEATSRPELVEELNKIVGDPLGAEQAQEELESIWSNLMEAREAEATDRHRFFQGIARDEVEAILKRSHIIECSAGDSVIRKGQVTRTMFVVLAGALEVRTNGKVVNFISEGEVFGEVAFLLSVPRTVDVVAAVDGTRLLTIDESRLDRLIDTESKLACRLLLSLSRALCRKLVNSDTR